MEVLSCSQHVRMLKPTNDPLRFSESLQSDHAEIISSFFPYPSGNFELYIFTTPFSFSRGFIIVKGDDLSVLRVLQIQGSKSLRSDFPFAMNNLVCAASHLLLQCCAVICYCCEYLVFAVNILACAASYLLLLWIFWFVLSFAIAVTAVDHRTNPPTCHIDVVSYKTYM